MLFFQSACAKERFSATVLSAEIFVGIYCHHQIRQQSLRRIKTVSETEIIFLLIESGFFRVSTFYERAVKYFIGRAFFHSLKSMGCKVPG